MQQHCRDKHRWVNEWKKGGDVRKKSQQPRRLPWTTGVQCQRFFPSRAGSQWFEVARGQTTDEALQAAPNRRPARQAMDRVRDLRKVQAECVKTSHDELIRVANEKLEPSPWLARVGWAMHLTGLSASALFDITVPINEDEVVLQAMWATVDSVLDQARATSAPNAVGLTVLFEAQRTEAHVKPRRPFDNRMEDDTWARYKGVWRSLLCVWFRTQEMDDDKRPPYRLTPSQGEAWDLFENMAEVASKGTGDQTPETRESAALDMLISMLDHQLKGRDSSSALLSALAVMGIAEDGGWVQITDYTTKYSAVIKVARMLVIHQAYTERHDEVAELERSLGKR
ncbi:hypothetical protein CSAL01_12760 [Colletotrichum salicis]|uniref:Uncharacterized protein n=1 Tax=Colletotrichum salicis TaxID=1209931 RepID=A0A135V9Z3_9PEZI|nr:hypothetical protein CSAL01_12760 [Colletotrichum salicis]